MSLARFRRFLLMSLGGLALALLSSCQSRLPGPLDCERMAARGIGISLKEIRGSALATNVVTVVTHSCITTPFDHETLSCMESGYGLRRCTDELAQRDPTKKAALDEMIRRIRQLDRKGRSLK